MVSEYALKVREAASFLRNRLQNKPEFGIVLGTGFGSVADSIDAYEKIPYGDIPNFPTPTAPGHKGVLYHGSLRGVPIIGLQGRTHFYEVGDEPGGIKKVVFAANVLAELGVSSLFTTNATGGLRSDFNVGDFVLIRSHAAHGIPNPWLGQDYASFKKIDGKDVERFPPMTGAYDAYLRSLLKEAGKGMKGVYEGDYMAVSGPTYETETEGRLLKDQGIAVVGMSTYPEITVAYGRGMKCVGMATVSDVLKDDGSNPTSDEEVRTNMLKNEARQYEIITKFFDLYKSQGN